MMKHLPPRFLTCCDHDDDAHDRELGCVFPECRCPVRYPRDYRVRESLRVANEGTRFEGPPYGVPHRLGLREKIRLFFALTGLGVPAGLLIAVAIVALVLMLACGFPAKPDPSPAPSFSNLDRPLQTAIQPAPSS